MDYTNIIAEDPVQLHISSTFFLGDANIVLKSIKGIVNGLNIVDNMFSGKNHGVEIVKLETSITPFNQIKQVFVERNVVNGMNLKATSAIISLHGNGTSWIADFNKVLIFPNLIRNVQYSLSASSGNMFPMHVIRNVSNNCVFIETNEVVTANVFVKVDQCVTIWRNFDGCDKKIGSSSFDRRKDFAYLGWEFPPFLDNITYYHTIHIFGFYDSMLLHSNSN